MALSNFTILKNPFTGTLLTDVNTLYIDADEGDDSNPGTRALPKKLLTQPYVATITTYVIRGKFNESPVFKLDMTRKYILGDLNTEINGVIDFQGVAGAHGAGYSIFNIKTYQINALSPSNLGIFNETILKNCVVELYTTSNSLYNRLSASNSLFLDVRGGLWTQNHINYVTLRDVFLFSVSGKELTIIEKSLFCGTINIPIWNTTEVIIKLNSCVIRKQCKWRYNGIEIPVTWTTPLNFLNDLKNSMIAYATTLTNVQQRDGLINFANTAFGANIIIHDDDTPNVRLFNRYDATGNVIDYSLNLHKDNPALYITEDWQYTGALRAKQNIVFNSAREINDNGVETGDAGTLLVNGVDEDIFIDLTSSQKRNRMQTNVIAMQPGDMFTQWMSDFVASNSIGIYLGAKQTITVALFPINGIVVTPYDTQTTPSAFPKFLTPLNSRAEIAYLNGNPVKFNDLAGMGITTNKNIAECGTWAVSNACHEWSSVMEITGVTANRPLFRYFILELIANNFS